VLAFGEILWDLFGTTRRLGGAPLNFAAHLHSLGHPVALVSALGDDALGREARERIAALGLDTTLIGTSARAATGTATVELNADGEPVFAIARPAAYDTLELPQQALALEPDGHETKWLYFGSLIAATPQGRENLDRLLASFAKARRFLDLNLRAGTDAPALITALLGDADVVKLNEAELARVCDVTGLPRDIQSFCRQGSERFGWQAVCVTLGPRGCAMLIDHTFVEGPGIPISVADTVGAGDAFAAGFIHGLSQLWPPERIAGFANRLGATVAAQSGSLPQHRA